MLILCDFIARYAVELAALALTYLCTVSSREQCRSAVEKTSPLLTRGKRMLTVQMQKQHNAMINEDIIVPRLVNTQVIEFSDWCTRMANGSTVTAADVAAVMQQIENKMLENLTLNAKITCSPSGLIFRPKVSGSLTQSQLKAKLQAKKAAETDPQKAALIDVNRAITTSDLSISDCTVSIEVDLPKTWSIDFEKQATLKRVKNSTTEVTENTDDTTSGGTDNGSGDSGSGDNGSGSLGNTDNGGGGGSAGFETGGE